MANGSIGNRRPAWQGDRRVFPRPIPTDRSANGEEENHYAGDRVDVAIAPSSADASLRGLPRQPRDRRAWLGDVLDQMFSEVLVGEVQLRFHLIEGLLRDANAAGLGKLLQARRDVDAFAVTVLVLDNHVTEVDADAYVDAPIFGDAVIALRHAALKDDRALDRVDDAAELGQQPVAHQLEDTPLVLFDLRLEQLLAMRPEPRERIRLVLLHEPGVADHVGGEDGGKVTLGAFFGHGVIAFRERSAQLFYGNLSRSLPGPTSGKQVMGVISSMSAISRLIPRLRTK